MHVTHVITTLDVGGAQTVLADLIGALATRALTQDVVVLGPPGAMTGRVEQAGASVRSLDVGPLQVASAVLTLRGHVRTKGSDVVVSWLHHADAVAVAALVGTHVPLVTSVHHTDLAPGDAPWHTRIARLVGDRVGHRRAARTVFVSPNSMQHHQQRGRTSPGASVITNGVQVAPPSASAVAAVRTDLGVPDRALLVVRLGRAHPQKDLPGFIAAMDVVCRDRDDVHALVIGPGVPEDPATQQAIEASPHGDRVHLRDVTDQPAAVLAAADVVVSSSSSGEAWPTVLLEALAVGTPVVATDVGDSRAIVGDAGRVVPARRPDLLAAAIEEVLALSPAARADMGAAGRDRVTTQHTVTRMADEWERLLLDVGCAGPSGG